MVLGPAMFFAKLSLLLLYLRIFAPQKYMRYTIYLAIGFLFCFYWFLVPLYSYFCAPFPGGSWVSNELGRKCTKMVVVGVVQGPPNVVVDLFLLILPVRSVLRLHLSLKRKMQVLGVFMTGILSVWHFES